MHHGSNLNNALSEFYNWTTFGKLMTSTFFCYTGHSTPSCSWGMPTGSNLAFFCGNGEFLQPANLDYGGGGSIPAAVQLRFWWLRAFWKAQDPLHWMAKAAPGRRLSSIGWHRQPWCCSGNEENELIVSLIRTRRRAGLSLDTYARELGPAQHHHDDLQQRRKLFL